jgi:hypothetical protein
MMKRNNAIRMCLFKGSYSIVISFITGFSKPGFDMSFTYKDVSVVVMEYRRRG